MNLDLTTVSFIRKDGIKFLYESYEQKENSLYEILYLSNSILDITNRNCKLNDINYIQTLLINNDCYIHYLINLDYNLILGEKGTKFYSKFIDNLLNIINNLDFPYIYKIYNNLFKLEKFKSIIYKNYWILDNNELSFLGKIINRLTIDASYKDMISHLYLLFDTLDKNSVENWFLSLLEKNKLYKQTYYIINNSTNNLVSLNFLNKSLLVIINYYKEFKEKGVIFKDMCTTDTIVNHEHDNGKENQSIKPNELYILDYILLLTEISLIASIFKINYYNKSLENLNDLLKIEEVSVRWNYSSSYFKDIYLNSIRKNINTITTKIGNFSNVLNELFIKDSIYIISELSTIEIPPNNINHICLILGYITKHNSVTSNTIDINEVYKNNIINLGLTILNSDKINFSSKSFIIDYLLLDFNKLSPVDVSIFMNVLYKLYINIECSNELEDYEKNNIKNSIIKNSIKYIQLDEIDSKLYLTSNFISVILSDISSYYEELIFCINNINVSVNSIIPLSDTQVIRNEENQYFETIRLNKYIIYFKNALDLVYNLINKIPLFLIEGINSNKLVSTINFWLKQLFTKKSIKLFAFTKYISQENLNFNWSYVYTRIYEIYSIYYKNDIFIKSIVDTTSDYVEFNTILKQFEKNTKDTTQSNYLSIIDNVLESIDKIVQNQVNYSTEIPPEFCDPLLYIPITEPIILPESNIILDKKTIINHLIHDKTDPFNRTPLTLEDIETHNKRLDILDKLNRFVNKFNKWKSENIK